MPIRTYSVILAEYIRIVSAKKEEQMLKTIVFSIIVSITMMVIWECDVNCLTMNFCFNYFGVYFYLVPCFHTIAETENIIDHLFVFFLKRINASNIHPQFSFC